MKSPLLICILVVFLFTGLGAQRKKAAEAEVNKWREQKNLQFPNLDPEHIKSLKDSLEWPPAGSKKEEVRE